jgi:CheY-like chemotaxis protein
VAHDFNNQLVGILAAAELLREGAADGEARLLAETIAQAARRSAELTQQLLAFARKGKLATLPVDVGAVVGEVVALLRRGVDKRIAMDVRLPAEPLVVLGDAAQLHHAMLNLALNACDAMTGGGGTLTLSGRRVDPGARERAPRGLPPGPLVVLAVEDTGPGIDPGARPHLFEPFFTTKEPGKGSGLGLAAVYGTIRGHRGAISVASEPGMGTAFTVWLPAVDGAKAVAVRSAASPAAAPRRRVLVVDDEALVRTSLTRVLAHDGHEVVTADSGRAALDVHARERGRIDVVVLDMMMPDLSGTEVFRLLRAAEPGLRVVLSSGYSLESEAQALIDAGGVSVLQKPYTVDEVRRVLAAAVGAGR